MDPISAPFKDLWSGARRMTPRTFEGTSVCVKAAPHLKRSKAIRLTVPRIIVEVMELHPGDALRWVAETSSGRVTVTKTERPPTRR